MSKQDRERIFAQKALDLMAARDIVATPANFELFYTYAAGESPALTMAMDTLIAAGKFFSSDLLESLGRHLRPEARAAAAMDMLGGDMSAVIAEVLGRLEDSVRETADYKNRLNAVTGELGGERSPADLRRLVDNLIAATRAMEQRAKALEDELQASSQQVSELRDKLDDVRKESLTDPLTGIANRKAFDDAMRQVEAQMRMAPEPEGFTLLICDIDHFKRFNDSWGHQTGDQVLRLVAQCLSENVKGRDTTARYGGEEFVVLLRGASLPEGTRVANHIRQSVESKKLVKRSTGETLGKITISIGVAQFGAGETAEAVIRRADACLYGAKHHGRNLVVNQDDPRMAALESSAA